MQRMTQTIGMPIRGLQYMLRVIAKSDSSIPVVVPDGIYGKNTMQAVTAFQSKAGLPMTGITDRDTWNAITQAFQRASVFQLAAEPVLPALQPSQIIKVGEPNLHLYVVQSMLKAISEVYPNVPTLDVTGIHDGDSVASIEWLQEISGLPVTGEIDRETWQILARLYRVVVRDGTPETIARSLQGQPSQEQPPQEQTQPEAFPDAPPSTQPPAPAQPETS